MDWAEGRRLAQSVGVRGNELHFWEQREPEVEAVAEEAADGDIQTEEDFQQLMSFIEEIRYDQAYTFIYSKRSGTPAAEMDNQVEDAVKHQRLNRLMELQNSISLEINQQLVGRTLEVMVEGPSHTDETVWNGRTDTNKLVLWQYTGKEKPGDLVKVKIQQAQTWILKGTLEA